VSTCAHLTPSQKVRDRFLSTPTTSLTLQSLVRSELSPTTKPPTHTATEGLLWLVRGLDFTAQSLRADISSGGTQELAASFRAGYKTTLAPHHSFMVQPIFSAAMSATPYRKDFAKKVAGGSEDVKVQERAEAQMREWVGALEERVKILREFLASKEAKW
jgi:hypothetical protein